MDKKINEELRKSEIPRKGKTQVPGEKRLPGIAISTGYGGDPNGLFTDHRPDYLIPKGVCPFPLSLLLYFLTMFPGEVKIELSPGFFEDFFSKSCNHIAQELLFLLRPQFLDLPLNLFNGHDNFPLLYYLVRYIISNYAKGIL